MHPRLRNLLLTATALLALGAAPGVAGPEGPSVVGGAATITGAGTSSVMVNQSTGRAIINWNTFNIGTGENVRFNQPGSSSVVLNRVTGGLGPSQIFGTLTANGQVFVINRDGVLFGAGSVINTAGFLASTNDIRNSDFMAGRYIFNIPGRPDASIVNMGTITAASGGFAALVAPGVRNSGTISATLGTVALAAGNSFTLDMYGDKLITLAVNDQIASQVIDVATGKPLKSLVTNDGKIRANGGRVELTAAAARTVVDSVINTSGVIKANSIGRQNGMIVLSAGTGASKPAGAPRQTVKVSGTLSAAGKKPGTTGGTILVTGEDIKFVGALVDASGRAGGGKVMIGGDWGGGKPGSGLVNNQSAKLESYAIATATTVSVDAGTTINASATESGHGGKVVLWSDKQTNFDGTILARGGANGGDGGFVETSSKQLLNYSGTVDTRAPFGTVGTLLLDPENYYINATGTPPGLDPTASAISASALVALLNTSNVVISTLATGPNAGDINVDASVNWSSNNTLTLNAFRNINVGYMQTISNTGGGSLVLRADSTGTGSGTVNFPGGQVNFTASTGMVHIFYNPTNTPNPNKYDNPQPFGFSVLTASAGQLVTRMLVNSAADLQLIGTGTNTLNQSYALGRNISGGAFNPIGSVASPFTGVLDGQGHSISNLTVQTTGAGDTATGIFSSIGAAGIVRNLALSNITINANPNVTAPGQFLGTLAGLSSGTITNVTTTGLVHGGAMSGVIAGGLVGQLQSGGTITQSSAMVNVTTGNAISGAQMNNAGGLVGTVQAGASIVNSSALGSIITTGFNTFAGGLVGRNDGTITNSNSSNAVSGIAGSGPNDIGSSIGGLAGFNSGTISGSFASGPATGTTASAGQLNAVIVGGLVGLNNGAITSSYATGPVTGSGKVELGGLVGGNFGAISASYATGSASTTGASDGMIGGLVGLNGITTVMGNLLTGTIANSYATGGVHATGDVIAGGLVGSNSSSITSSHATGSVNGGFSAGGLVGSNQETGTIANSYATGAVTLNATAAGASALNATFGLNAGGLVGNNEGQITSSHATGAVNLTGDGVAGGLVGFNSSTGTIANSYATGAVTMNSAFGLFQNAGGLVGNNEGQITSSHATGAVHLTGDGAAGGLVGFNSSTGTIANSYATGAVTMNATFGLLQDAGGLVGNNEGQIASSYATGAVNLTGGDGTAGGLVGFNSGTITNSYATGNVTHNAAILSIAGGLVGLNEGSISSSFATGAVVVNATALGVAGGLVGSNFGEIFSSYALGSVTGGDGAIVGGFAGINFGSINNAYALGNVLIGSNAFAGGFVGLNAGLIRQAFAAGSVSEDAGSVLGGFAGFNVGRLLQTIALGAVTGGDNSIVGGHTGINLAIPDEFGLVGGISQSYSLGAVSGGANSIVAGGIAVNDGLVDQFYAAGRVSGGPGSNLAGLIAVNNPSGSARVTNSYWDINTTGQTKSAAGTGLTTREFISALPPGFDPAVWKIQAGSTYPFLFAQDPFVPPFTPRVVADNPDTVALPQPHPQAQIIENLVQNIQLAALNTDPVVNMAALTAPTARTPQQPQRAAPANPYLPPGFERRIFDIPPLSETRFIKDEVLLQISTNVTVEQVQEAVRRFGLTLIEQQSLGATTGSIALRFRIGEGQSLRDIIRQLASVQILAVAQPIYVYVAGQDPAADPASRGAPAQQGDAAQYILQKLKLTDVHRIVKGANIPIAVIDSEIDAAHPDLAGVIAQRFSAAGAPETPHPHGTGMAGAIASRQRLLGVAPSARLLAVHAFSSSAAKAESTTYNILKGLDWSVKEGARIINMSFAGPKDPSLERSLKAAYDKGIVLIAAAGNAGPRSPPLYPGADKNVIAVTATDIDDKLFTGANRGGYVAVAAPGVDILVPAPNAGYQLTTGTSVAAAEVSGVVALLLERNPRLKPADIKRILTTSAKRLGPGERNDDFGSGLVDPLNALQAADPRTAGTPPPRR